MGVGEKSKTKLSGGCGTTMAELILVIFNIVFLLCGAVVLSFGIIALVDPDLMITLLDWIPGFSDVQYLVDIAALVLNNAIILTVIGSVILLLSFLGGCGACKANKCMLTVYWIVILLGLLFELAIVMWAAIETDKIQTKVADNMFSALTTNFDPVYIDGNQVILSNKPEAAAWETLQFDHSCCGAHDYMDYQLFPWNSTFTISDTTYINVSVPPSCCMQFSQNKIANNTADFVNLTECLSPSNNNTNSTMYRNTQGCYVTMLTDVTKNSFITTIIIAGLIAIEVIAIMLAFYMQMQINKVAPAKNKPRKQAANVPPADYD